MAHASRIVAVIRPVRFCLDLTVGVKPRVDQSQDECGVMSRAEPCLPCHRKITKARRKVQQRNWDDRAHRRDEVDGRDSRPRLRSLNPAFDCTIAVTCTYPCARLNNPPPVPAAHGCSRFLVSPLSGFSISSIATWTIWLGGCT